MKLIIFRSSEQTERQFTERIEQIVNLLGSQVDKFVYSCECEMEIVKANIMVKDKIEVTNKGGLLIKPIPGQVVAQCDKLPEMKANARLIAAAPELLDACEFLIDGVRGTQHGISLQEGSLKKMQFAIKKARGK
jgi:hypothetical protein